MMNSSINNNTLVLASEASIEVEELKDKIFSFSINPGVGSFSSEWVFSWDLGDGTCLDDSEPIHEYTVPGTYSVNVMAALDEPKRFPEGFMDTVSPEPIYLSFSLRVA